MTHLIRIPNIRCTINTCRYDETFSITSRVGNTSFLPFLEYDVEGTGSGTIRRICHVLNEMQNLQEEVLELQSDVHEDFSLTILKAVWNIS